MKKVYILTLYFASSNITDMYMYFYGKKLYISPIGDIIVKKVWFRTCGKEKCNVLAKFPLKYCEFHRQGELLMWDLERGWK